MTHEKMPEALIFANDRPTSLDDDLYQWAIDAEQLIRRQHADIERLRGVSFDLNRALAGAISQLRMAGDCIESGRNDEALLHTRSLLREKREAIEHYAALQSTKEQP